MRSNDLVTAVGRRLRALREAQNLTQEQVAERSGFTSKYVSEIERGVRDLPLHTLQAVVERGLGSSLADLFVAVQGTRAAERAASYRIAPLPPNIERLARRISRLPSRRRLLPLLWRLLAYAEGEHRR